MSDNQHTTFAGARLDPNLSGGAQGLTSESSGIDSNAVHQEGIDHIKSQSGLGGDSASSGLGSNTGLGSTTGGLGGDSTTATTTGSQDQTGMVGTIKSYLGFADGSGEQQGVAGTSATDSYATDSTAGNTAGVVAPGLGGADARDSSGYDTGLSGSDRGLGSDSGAGLGSNETAGLGRDSTTAPSGLSDSAARGDSTTDYGNRSGSAAEQNPEHSSGTAGGEGEMKSDQGGEKKASSKPTGKLENRDAIPIAGGTRLGEQHWGESKIVPDVPPTREEEQAASKGVSSAEGQPTDQVRDNTSRNMGGATGGPGSGQDAAANAERSASDESASSMDKIKAKLHMGGS